MPCAASSHREAPFISGQPQVDATDFFMFTSYEAGRSDYVTIIANYNPFQDPDGGPIFFPLNQNAVYDINIDNDGDAKPNLVFRFQFTNHYRDLKVPAGADQTAVPLINIGKFRSNVSSVLNRYETYTVTQYQGTPGTNGAGQMLTSATGSSTFNKPVDNVGNKSIADYDSYANQYVYNNVKIPGCAKPGRVFVGQRKDPFVVNVGEIFDLVNYNPVGPRDSTQNALHNKNVTEIALEVPKSCLVNASGDPVIGGYTTASLRSARMINPTPKGENNAEIGIGGYTQVSRLAAPLVNEVIIGLPDKDRFNASQPKDDSQFLHYVTNPSLPVLLNALFGGAAQVPHTPRNDLVTAFLTGVPGLNQPAKLTAPGEELRLNTSTPPTAPASQNDLGVLGGDLAGFPNGRRPYDDGRIGSCGDENSDPNRGAPYTDGARAAGATAATERVTGDEYANDTYLDHFPYFLTPLPGSPNGKNGLPSD